MSGQPSIGVLALQGDVREHLRMLAACGARPRPVRRPSELDDVAALVIPGGESTTISKLALDFGLTDPIRKRIAGGMPGYGSCAGMVMLAAEVLDGRPDQVGFGGIEMTVRRNAFGRQVDSFEAPVVLGGLGGAGAAAEPLRAVFIRAPWVERVGPGVAVLGRVASTGAPRASTPQSGAAPDGRIVAVRQGSLLATAFHPELTGDLRVHRLFVEMAREVDHAARSED
ncbi:MAG: pyridoxal 5'-phosphate synthase glutaminase subunit PdxT [Micromonosporaceae bacterium]|nr:pyridoxal 5'-phosphate synthase glutaminase subunit PdxT [Micromonosporaceae bacterium]